MSPDSSGHEGGGGPTETSEGRLLSKTDLHGRGWTESAIRRFLGQPDGTKRNPCYRSAAPICLYYPERVAAAEATADFKAWLAASTSRRKCAQDSARRRAQGLAERIARWNPPIPALPMDDLRKRAIQSYNERNRHREWEGDPDRPWTPASETSDPAFLARIMVNYLRHEATNYDELLDHVRSKAGVREARAMIRERVYAAIAEQYPELEAEVRAQRRGREERDDLRDLRRG